MTVVCEDCKHCRRGFDSTERTGRPPSVHFRICATEPITPGRVEDHVSGRRAMDTGTACAKINSDGECDRFETRHDGGEVEAIFFGFFLVVAVVVSLTVWGLVTP